MGLCLPLCKRRRLDQTRQFQTFYWNNAQGQSAREDATQRKRTPCWLSPPPPPQPWLKLGHISMSAPVPELGHSSRHWYKSSLQHGPPSLQYAQLILENYGSAEGRVSLEEGVLVLGWEGWEHLNRGRGAGKASRCGEEYEQCLGRE